MRIVNGEIVRDAPAARRSSSGGGGGVATLASLAAEREQRGSGVSSPRAGTPSSAARGAAPAPAADGALAPIATALGIAGKSLTLPPIPAIGLRAAVPIPLVHAVVGGAVLLFAASRMELWRVALIGVLGGAAYLHATVTTPL